METVIRTKIKDLLKAEAGKEVLAKGWVRTKRGNKNVAFIALNDGSTINNIQIVVDKTPENESILAKVTRDDYMLEMAQTYPGYGFEIHKGYGTKAHYEALTKLGACPIHRTTFLKKFYGEK